MTEKTATINEDKIEINFPFDWSLVETVKEIQGREYDKAHKLWTVPLTPWHSKKVVEIFAPLGFHIDPQISKNHMERVKPVKLELPEGLYPFQEEGVKFALKVGGRCIIADDMGLGKTITALAFVGLYTSRTLVISPANVTYKWLAECEKWLPDRKVQVIDTGKQEITKADIDIMSYSIMVNKYDELITLPYDIIIFDESHYIKNSKAQRTRVAKAIVRQGMGKILFLSGTPFMNHPSELFPMLNLLDPLGYANYYTYAQRYCGAKYEMGTWFFPPGGTSNLGELAERLSGIMIRHTKQEVLKDLPELSRTLVPVAIDNLSEYKTAARDMKIWLHEHDKEVADPNHVLTRLNILRQIVGQGKVSAAIELAESVLQDEGRKVVLFAHHQDVVNQLYEALKGNGCLKIVGDTPNEQRKKNSNLFLSLHSPCRVMIISVAGAEGIDLYSAYDIIFVEREWTPAREEQAEARLHRIGQKNAVQAWYLVAKHTVDEKLARVVDEKRKIFGQVIRQDEIIREVLSELEA